MRRTVVIKTLHKFVAVAALLMASQISAEPFKFNTDKAYMLVRATTANEAARNPTWIALFREPELIHVSADKLIIELTPGTYGIHHFDFGKSKNTGYGTRDVIKSDKMKLVAGEVFLAGELVLEGTTRLEDKFVYADTMSLITAACEMAPDFFKHFPLRTYNQKKSVLVPCGKLLDQKADTGSTK